MALLDKYKVLIDTATASEVADLQYLEQDGVLQIRGTAPDANTKNNLWDIYNQIDPNFLSGDVVMNIDVSSAVAGSKVRVVTQEGNLNVRKGPGTDQPIVGKVAKGEEIILLSRANSQWWLVRLKNAQEGYCYAQYLEPIG